MPPIKTEYKFIDKVHELDAGEDAIKWTEGQLNPLGADGWEIHDLDWGIVSHSTQSKKKELAWCRGIMKRPLSEPAHARSTKPE